MITFREFFDLCAAAGLGAIDRGSGHWQIRRSAMCEVVVNWWPESARQTVYISEIGSRFSGVAEPERVVGLARIAFRLVAGRTHLSKFQFDLESLGRRYLRGRLTGLAEALDQASRRDQR